jgi:hypothetical protein
MKADGNISTDVFPSAFLFYAQCGFSTISNLDSQISGQNLPYAPFFLRP